MNIHLKAINHINQNPESNTHMNYIHLMIHTQITDTITHKIHTQLHTNCTHELLAKDKSHHIKIFELLIHTQIMPKFAKFVIPDL